MTTAGQWFWTEDEHFDLEYHFRHSALPKPGRIRELLELCGRLHSTRLALERPLWEVHLIEGLRDGRVAMYTKMHHALVDGVSSMRLLQRVLLHRSRRARPRPDVVGGARRPRGHTGDTGTRGHRRHGPLGVSAGVLRGALGISADAAGLPGALVRTLSRGVRNETSALSLYAPRTIINKKITGSRRFAAEDWPMERIQAVGKATGTTVNDVVLAMCSGAMRTYLDELGALPDASLVAMVPVGLKAKSLAERLRVRRQRGRLGDGAGSAPTRPTRPTGWRAMHHSMLDRQGGARDDDPGADPGDERAGPGPRDPRADAQAPGLTRPPFNLIISNVPGPREPHYFNGARLEGVYPLSIPIHGMGLNITCTSYDGKSTSASPAAGGPSRGCSGC